MNMTRTGLKSVFVIVHTNWAPQSYTPVKLPSGRTSVFNHFLFRFFMMNCQFVSNDETVHTVLYPFSMPMTLNKIARLLKVFV